MRKCEAVVYIVLMMLYGCASQAGGTTNVTIGLIAQVGCCSPWQSIYNQGSAMNIAYRHLRAAGILNDTYFRIVWRNTSRESEGVGHVVDLVQNDHVDVIFGSPDSDISVASAFLTSHWNVPQISWVSTSYELSDKTKFTTFVRTLGPYSKIGAAFISILKKFGWTKVGFMHEGWDVCQHAVDGIRASFSKANITIMQSIAYETRSLSMERIDTYLRLIRRTCRIVIICDAHGNDLRKILVRACDHGMCKGDYVFIMPGNLVNHDYETKRPWERFDKDDRKAKKAYTFLLFVSIATWYDEKGEKNLLKFEKEVIVSMAEPPWNDSFARDNGISASQTAQYLYDAMYFYGLWVNYTIINNISRHNGGAMLDFSNHLQFPGISGPCRFDDRGDRIPLYWIWDYTEEKGHPRIAAIADTTKTKQVLQVRGWKGFKWFTANGRPPPDTPVCGYFNEFCPVVQIDNMGVITAAFMACIAGSVVGAIIAFFARKRQNELNMMKMMWKIYPEELVLNITDPSAGSLRSKAEIQDIAMLGSEELPNLAMPSQVVTRAGVSNSATLEGSRTHISADSCSLIQNTPPLTTVGIYRGIAVAIRNLPRIMRAFTREELLELKEMREMQHENLNVFIGACVDGPKNCILFTYCAKGSLQDILENEDMKLDTIFKYSLMLDLIQGMCFIHDSKLNLHGRLKSGNCLVTNRWVLKITDYGLCGILAKISSDVPNKAVANHATFTALLWTAPELLQSTILLATGTRAGDVYSFSIILHEIFYRMGPFAGKTHMASKDIIGRVRNRESIPCRPELFDDNPEVTPTIVKLLKISWCDAAEERPTFQTIRSYVKKNIQGIHGVNKNIVDIILQRLEKYANNLEELVEQRTQQLVEEKMKTDKLLYRMLPVSCADKLKVGQSVEPELYESATIFFSDIVGFTTIAGKSTPIEVVSLLNDLYTHFDEIIAQHDAYKVETIGDAYLVVSGIPIKNENHAGVIATMSLVMLSGLKDYKVRHMPDHRLMVRIGMHTGPCCAGVVGLSLPKYCLFGDTVNTASRMESHGEKQRIHMSEDSYNAIIKLGGFYTSYRGEIDIKGKGVMRTYWLEGKQGFKKDSCPNVLDRRTH